MKRLLILFIVLATSLVAQGQPVRFEKEPLLRPDYIPIMGEIAGGNHYIEYSETYHAFGYKTPQGGFVFYEPVASNIPATAESAKNADSTDENGEGDKKKGSFGGYILAAFLGALLTLFLVMLFEL